MIESRLFIVPVDNVVEESAPMVMALSKVLLGVHDIVHRIIYLWLCYGKEFTIPAMEEELMEYVEEIAVESGIIEYLTEDEFNEVLICVSELAKSVYRVLEPVFQSTYNTLGSGLAISADIEKGNDNDLYLRVKYNPKANSSAM